MPSEGTCHHCGKKVELEICDPQPEGEKSFPDPHLVLKNHFNQIGYFCRGSGNIPREHYEPVTQSL